MLALLFPVKGKIKLVFLHFLIYICVSKTLGMFFFSLDTLKVPLCTLYKGADRFFYSFFY